MEKIKYCEIRKEAWTRLFGANGWFWRIVGSLLLFGFVGQIVLGPVQKMTEVALAAGSEREFGMHTVGALLLFLFVALVINAIGAYGGARVFVNCVRSSSEGCVKAMFSGFKSPLSLLALYFCLVMIVIFALVIPLGLGVVCCDNLTLDMSPHNVYFGLGAAVAFFVALWIAMVLFYRYRFAFFLKVDNPDWSAVKCVRESTARMRGKKWRLFMLDCSYWLSITVVLVLMLAVMATTYMSITAESAGLLFADAALIFAAMCASYVVGVYFAVGGAIFYRDYVANVA